MNYRLLKSEPYVYSRSSLIKDGLGVRDGVRSYEARNNLAKMKIGDLCFFYHSNEGKEIVGICVVVEESYPDPTSDNPKRLAVKVKPVEQLSIPVTLASIKSNSKLKDINLIRKSRLSVAPVTANEFDIIMKMSQSINFPQAKIK